MYLLKWPDCRLDGAVLVVTAVSSLGRGMLLTSRTGIKSKAVAGDTLNIPVENNDRKCHANK